MRNDGEGRSSGDAFRIRVPASIANLGPGFDTLAVAVNLYLTLSAHIVPGTDDLQFRFQNGAPQGMNCIARAFHFMAAQHPVQLPSLAVEVHSEIPMRAGLGSSAAATIAGLQLFAAASDSSISTNELLTVATLLEGHPDNVAAALLGGLTISRKGQNETVTAVSIAWPKEIRFLVFTPEAGLATAAARNLLPRHYAREEAIGNLQSLAWLLWALTTGSYEHLREAMQDSLHQPYRESAVPGLAQFLRFEHPRLIGTCLSGAGPSLLALVREQDMKEVREALEQHHSRAGLAFTVRELAAHEGASATQQPIRMTAQIYSPS